MRRRALLSTTTSAAAALGAAGMAGCLGTLGGPELVNEDDTVTIGGAEFELGALRIQSTFVEQGDPFWHWNAVANPDGQFATVVLRPQGDEQRAREALRDASITAEVDGEVAADDHCLNEEDYGGIQVGVPVPDGERFEDAAVVFEDAGRARYGFSELYLDELADPPRYDVDVNVPDSFDGTQLPVELVVTNTGDSLGTIAWTTTHSRIEDGWYTNEVTVGAGDTERAEHVHTRLRGDPGDEIGVTADWGFDELEKRVPVDDD